MNEIIEFAHQVSAVGPAGAVQTSIGLRVTYRRGFLVESSGLTVASCFSYIRDSFGDLGLGIHGAEIAEGLVLRS